MGKISDRKYLLLDFNTGNTEVIDYKDLKNLIKEYISIDNYLLVNKLSITGTLEFGNKDTYYKVQRIPVKFANLLSDIDFKLSKHSSLNILDFMYEYTHNKRVEVVISNIKVYKQVNIHYEKIYTKKIYHCTLYANSRCTIKTIKDYTCTNVIPKGKDMRIFIAKKAEDNMKKYTLNHLEPNNINAYCYTNYTLL